MLPVDARRVGIVLMVFGVVELVLLVIVGVLMIVR